MTPCSAIRGRAITAPCIMCGRRPEGEQKLHIVRGEYFCGLHCPVHGYDGQERAAIQEEAKP